MHSFLSILLAAPAALALATIDKRQTSDTIPGQWIARIHADSDVNKVLSTFRRTSGLTPTHQYEIGSFKGFAFNADEDALESIASLDSIESIEPDTIVLPLLRPAEWGLARISHRNPGASNYIYDNTAGQGTTIYVVDTGILPTHSEFGGRASVGANFVPGEASTDLNGHGTHCAGTAAGSTYGVAKRASIIGVKVLARDGSGSNSGVLSGIQWAVSDATRKGITGRSVITLSLGCEFSQTSNNAVAAAIRAGIFTTVAAGNKGENAENASPASEPTVFTVGATDRNDARASFSNFRSLLDIFVPGVSINSAWIGSNSATNTISGTSMATPHVAGLAAYLLGLEGTRTPAALSSRLISLATTGKVTSAGSGSPNRIAYNGNGA